MTKKFLFPLAALCVILTVNAATIVPTGNDNALQNSSVQTSFIDRIAHLEGVSNLTVLSTDHFVDKCVFFVEQPLDYKDPSKGVFKQRVFVSHRGFDRPTVFVTEGYGAAYAANARHTNELADMFQTNLVVVEHRYFLESTPTPRDWTYLTAENSANDLHHIFTALKTVYPEKWISTGVSKGGQTTMIYCTFFPDDMDIAVPYVGPLNRDVEDGRHELFLRDKVGTPEQRAIILNFQLELLKRRSKLMPLFTAHCEERKFQFRTSLDEIFDFSVLEYSYAHWQYGTPIEQIPASDASDEELFKQFIAVSSPRYFQDDSSIESFFVQAERELGYYGYDLEPFAAYLTIKSDKGYLKKLVVPKDADVIFDKTLYLKICAYLESEDPHMVFIYGEYDPWSATAADVSVDMKHKKNIIVAYVPKGSHNANIQRLPEDVQKKVTDNIRKWLE
jgi:hypothetical protein